MERTRRSLIPTIALVITALLVISCGAASPAPVATTAATTQAASATTATPSPKPAPATVRFLIHFAMNPAYTYLVVGQEKGFFANEGLDVQLSNGSGSLAALTQLSQDKWDFSTGDFGDVIKLNGQGAKLKSIVAVYQTSPVGYGVLTKSGITSPKDFVGKKYGSQPSNLATQALPFVCQQYQIDCARITVVNVDFGVQVQSFLNGDFDILGGFKNVQGSILQNLGQDIRWIPAADVYQEMISTTDAMLAKQPDVVKRFLNATKLAMASTVEKQDEALAILLKRYPQLGSTDDAKKLAAAQLKDWATLVSSDLTKQKGYGYIDPSRAQATLSFYERMLGTSGTKLTDVIGTP